MTKKYTDVHIFNMLRDLAPTAEIKIVRSWKGNPTSRTRGCFLVNGQFCHILLRELDRYREDEGHQGVMRELATFLKGTLKAEVRFGIYDESKVEEQRKRQVGRRAEMLEFAMKSAGSSDEEIYEALKDG